MNSGAVTLQINFTSAKWNTKINKKSSQKPTLGPRDPRGPDTSPPRAKQEMKYKLK